MLPTSGYCDFLKPDFQELFKVMLIASGRQGSFNSRNYERSNELYFENSNAMIFENIYLLYYAVFLTI